MKQSTQRILTTHVGSLPRPPDLLQMIQAKEQGAPFGSVADQPCQLEYERILPTRRGAPRPPLPMLRTRNTRRSLTPA